MRPPRPRRWTSGRPPWANCRSTSWSNALEAPIYELYWHAGSLSSLKDIKTDGSGFYYYFYDANWER